MYLIAYVPKAPSIASRIISFLYNESTSFEIISALSFCSCNVMLNYSGCLNKEKLSKNGDSRKYGEEKNGQTILKKTGVRYSIFTFERRWFLIAKITLQKNATQKQYPL